MFIPYIYITYATTSNGGRYTVDTASIKVTVEINKTCCEIWGIPANEDWETSGWPVKLTVVNNGLMYTAFSSVSTKMNIINTWNQQKNVHIRKA